MASLKVSELRSLIERFANTLEVHNADMSAVLGLRALCAMFSGNEAASAATFLKAVGRTLEPAVTEGEAPVACVAPALASLRTLVDGFAREDLNKSLDSLLDTLRVHADVPISAFVAAARKHVVSASKPKGKRGARPMDQDLINDYVRRLEAALGDDGRFNSLLDDLRADPRIAQAEAVVIASRFYGRTPNRTSRSKALGHIRERHEKLMQFKREPSTAGRPAA